MNGERIGVELIVATAVWFLVVLAAFFFVGPVMGIIAILVDRTPRLVARQRDPQRDVGLCRALRGQCSGAQGQLAPGVAKPAAETPAALVDPQSSETPAEPAEGAEIEHRVSPRALAPTATHRVALPRFARAEPTSAWFPSMDDDRGAPPTRAAGSVHAATISPSGLFDLIPPG
jgi:hypothetical protein